MHEETPWFPDISEFTRINPFLFHLSKYRCFPIGAKRLGGSSPGTSVAQPDSHRVTVLGLGTCQCEAWPQGNQRQSSTGTCCKTNPCCEAPCWGCCRPLWERLPKMKHQSPPSHFFCLPWLPFPKSLPNGFPQGCKSQNQQRKK